MNSIFDIITVTLFLCGVAAFVFLTDRRPATVSRLLVSGVAVAVANQLGNAGHEYLAGALVVAASAYAVIIVRSHPA
ncbi:XrtV sorting system accessory protein [Rhodoblastus sp.]|uniref:XrtV sorting system accessory protein n=1 Tax=Rhodoblastus sp. TaxID=1962975 RepID=UPI003F9995C6